MGDQRRSARDSFFTHVQSAVTLVATLMLGSLTVLAQTPTMKAPATRTPPPPPPPSANQQTTQPPAKAIDAEPSAAIRVTVLTQDKKAIDRRAVVKLSSQARQTTNWQTTGDRSETVFGDLTVGAYSVEVSAMGYVTAHQDVEVKNLIDTIPVEIVLQRDPMSAEPSLTGSSLTPKASLAVVRAVKALNSGDLKSAQRHLEEADKLAPSNSRVKFLYGYMSFQQANLDDAEQYLGQATTLNPRYGEALTLLGRVQLARGRYNDSLTTLERAVTTDVDSWMAHYLLANAYLQEREYAKAQEQAQLAIDKNKKDGAAAQLALAEALANQGKTSEATQALKTFLASHSETTAAAHARELLAALEQQPASAGQQSGAVSNAAAFAGATDVVVSTASSLPELSWQPPSVDEAPPVATGVNCPTSQVIDGAGAGVQQLVTDVSRFAAIEDLVHERLDMLGSPVTRETRKFDYAASIYQSQPDLVLVEEYRTERYGLDSLPDKIADNGFAALALVFHPAMRDAFQMTCEGLGTWRGQPTWLVRFQQRDDRPNRMQAYLVGGVRYPVNLKGRAWITADKFQVVRIETEMVSPMPQIELVAEHQITEYGPVPFHKKGLELWLPRTAEVYLEFRGRRYYRRHTFEKYMLFSVEEEQKIKEAKHDSTGPESQNPQTKTLGPGL